MPNQMGELSSPLLTNPNDTYTISFGDILPGAYPIYLHFPPRDADERAPSSWSSDSEVDGERRSGDHRAARAL
jgi:hypothetical protein